MRSLGFPCRVNPLAGLSPRTASPFQRGEESCHGGGGLLRLAPGEVTGTCRGRQAWPVPGERWPPPQAGTGKREPACALPATASGAILEALSPGLYQRGFQWPLVKLRLGQPATVQTL